MTHLPPPPPTPTLRPLAPAELVALPYLLDPDHIEGSARAVSNLLDAGFIITRPEVEQ